MFVIGSVTVNNTVINFRGRNHLLLHVTIVGHESDYAIVHNSRHISLLLVPL